MPFGFVSGQSDESPLQNPHHREILENYDKRASDFAANNLNRFGLDRLHSYNRLLDSLFNVEKNDTLDKIEKAYLLNSSKNLSDIDSLKQGILKYTASEIVLKEKYGALVKKAMISFALWLFIILLLLQIRKVRFKKERSNLQSATLQLEAIEKSAKRAEGLFKQLNPLKESLQLLKTETTKIYITLTEPGIEKNSRTGWDEIINQAGKLKNASDLEAGITDALLSQSNIPGIEKQKTDINSLCEQYLEIASRGYLKAGNFSCQVTKDLEKKLPQINVIPEAVGSLLLNVLANAFQSIQDKHKLEIKGYQPKITVSTRILPRFLQIRIRDNGVGMTEETLNNSKSEFYSTRELGDGSGLGLFFAEKTISEMHKGEIKIESEKGASTDVYIKFFI
jgi:signal transduction histidine kinase